MFAKRILTCAALDNKALQHDCAPEPCPLKCGSQSIGAHLLSRDASACVGWRRVSLNAVEDRGLKDVTAIVVLSAHTWNR